MNKVHTVSCQDILYQRKIAMQNLSVFNMLREEGWLNIIFAKMYKCQILNF